MYTRIPQSAIPSDVCFDVPRRCAGQMVEVAYGGFGGFCRPEHDSGSPYKRITDTSDREVTYYKWSDAPVDRDAYCKEHGTPFDRCIESHE